jgi:type III secretory pathway lipoprotein EscJ
MEREGYSEPKFEVTVTPSAVPRAVAALRAVGPEHTAAERELPLIPTPNAEREAQERALQRRLIEALQDLPGVRHATVQIHLGDGSSGLSELLNPRQAAAATASIALVRAARSPLDLDHVRQLAAHLVPGLVPSAVALSDRPEAVGCGPCAELSHLGEVTVTSTSMGTLKLWLGASLLAHMLSAIALLIVLQRRRPRSTAAPARPER